MNTDFIFFLGIIFMYLVCTLKLSERSNDLLQKSFSDYRQERNAQWIAPPFPG